MLSGKGLLFDHFPSRPGGPHPGLRAAPASCLRIPATAGTEPAEALIPGWLSAKQNLTPLKFDQTYNNTLSANLIVEDSDLL